MNQVNYTMIQNNQYGICWGIKFDKQGEKTPEEFKDYSHDFIHLDHCMKCRVKI